ncbi:FAD-dependent oxidoreductase [Streptomyces uncialis]|uniref:FAD-dependent oxidoreductase n=1 Tax=Streptomyces uncialis TaxID=1048205 RepID=UPI0034061CDB
MNHPVAVVGAGPYGLSTAAHLRARGLPVRVFGEPMASWRANMPAGMLLKSTPTASNIDAPRPGHTLADYCAAIGARPLVSDEDLVPVETFTGYGEWFQQELVPELERVRVVAVEPRGDTFELKLDSGETCVARAVVVATGLSSFTHVPRELTGAAPDGPSPHGPLSHSSQHTDLSVFAGKDLAVVGAGQSALETAVLAAEAGARVRVVARGKGAVDFADPPWEQPRLRPVSPFGRAWSLYALSYHAQPYRFLPPQARHHLVRRVLGPLGAWWLRERFERSVTVREVRRVVRSGVEGSGPDSRPLLALEAPAGRMAGRIGELSADHVIAATGYRVDLAALDFLGHALRARLGTSRGTPLLRAGFVSSVPGLYFTGLPAAASYGPVMRFVCGTRFASPRLAAHLAAAHG